MSRRSLGPSALTRAGGGLMARKQPVRGERCGAPTSNFGPPGGLRRSVADCAFMRKRCTSPTSATAPERDRSNVRGPGRAPLPRRFSVLAGTTLGLVAGTSAGGRRPALSRSRRCSCASSERDHMSRGSQMCSAECWLVVLAPTAARRHWPPMTTCVVCSGSLGVPDSFSPSAFTRVLARPATQEIVRSAARKGVGACRSSLTTLRCETL